jgi:L-amino acid N-acyltransferase YncA
VTVRSADPADLPRIAAIYDDQVATSVATFDTSPPPSDYWRERVEAREPGHHCLVGELDGEVRGFAYASAYRPRPGYRLTRETSVYLDASARGQGLGRALYDELLLQLRGDGMHVALAVVALPNDASEALHRACGFEQVGVLPEVGRKFDAWVDTAFYALVL